MTVAVFWGGGVSVQGGCTRGGVVSAQGGVASAQGGLGLPHTSCEQNHTRL